jgi:hypothetical protein
MLSKDILRDKNPIYHGSHNTKTGHPVIAYDWHSLYQESIVLLETFVDVARFQGTCYRAANWRYVGDTLGIAKSGNGHAYHGQPKAFYLYPLMKDFR